MTELTRAASIETNSHGDMPVPRDHNNFDEACSDWRTQGMRDNAVSITVTTEYLINRGALLSRIILNH